MHLFVLYLIRNILQKVFQDNICKSKVLLVKGDSLRQQLRQLQHYTGQLAKDTAMQLKTLGELEVCYLQSIHIRKHILTRLKRIYKRGEKTNQYSIGFGSILNSCSGFVFMIKIRIQFFSKETLLLTVRPKGAKHLGLYLNNAASTL